MIALRRTSFDTPCTVEVELSDADLRRLDRTSAVDLGFPHDFPGRLMPYGDVLDRIDHAPGSARSRPAEPHARQRQECRPPAILNV